MNKITRPVLQIYINNTIESHKIHKFSISTDVHYPYCTPELELTGEYTGTKQGDVIKITLYLNNKTYTLFTGLIFKITYEYNKTTLHLIDGFLDLCNTRQSLSYRKEKALNILNDILEKAGVAECEITCPDVIFERFVSSVPANEIIKEIIETLKSYGQDEKYRFFFDTNNVFRFGTLDDTGINPGERFVLKSGVNIITKKGNCITTMPLPIRHSQEIEVDGKSFIPYRTEMIIGSKASRIKIWGQEAA